MLDFRVKTFITVCEYMNFTRASEALNITQPAVSQQIKYLEEYYGAKLFKYEGKKLLITPEGILLRDKLKQLRNNEEHMKEQLADLSKGSKEIKMGVTMTIGEYAIVKPLGSYVTAHPSTDIKVVYGNTTQLLKKLDNGELDFVLVEGYYPENEYAANIFSTEDFIAVCSASHKFVREPHSLKDLFSERLIVRESGSGTRNILEKGLGLYNYSISDFSHYIEASNMHMIIQLVENNCGISFLYKTAVASDIKNGTIRELSLNDFKVRHDFTFLWDRDSIFADEWKDICSELKSYYK